MTTLPNEIPAHDSSDISRRAALAALGGIGALAATGAPAFAQKANMTPDELGWDAARGEYVLPALPYPADALEPHIDAMTMTIHHDKHHAGYVRGLNNALAKLKEIREGSGDASLIKHWSRELAFHGSGHINHALFWQVMAPPGNGGGGRPSGDLARRIDRDFGSYDRFVEHFKAASCAVEGSGWGWLVYEPTADKLLVMQGEKQQNLTIWGVTPILGIDVWEHAYYLRYQNRRGEYVDAFMNVVNWPRVAQFLQRATA
ncbi:MAG: Fe-Mn family superoxide dismutase [Planctomycetota bacterium]|nr:Fe-Mn family superoxide dismutase [Planctomycetota bacterium]